jgi:hypothetical protein
MLGRPQGRPLQSSDCGRAPTGRPPPPRTAGPGPRRTGPLHDTPARRTEPHDGQREVWARGRPDFVTRLRTVFRSGEPPGRCDRALDEDTRGTNRRFSKAT